ncbi:hypothetical protein DTL42_13925 [Bremerella cremea]|uniref:CobN/magnesium chelatase domain-containing protein n=1 Tax=Bremerella cremea TaxID=1031537 RepID=A0A368KPP7_9BACT|nr:cobaltochelatase subunit CobN [Bremerella cremea]RCS47619.1 hypothetical protein DTL42_13925 [Bremerella cremea]
MSQQTKSSKRKQVNNTMKKLAVSMVLLLLAFGGGMWAYYEYLRPFRVAMIGFSDSEFANWENALRETPYSLHRYDDSGIDTAPLPNYNLVFIRGQGLNLSNEQVARIQKATARGTHFYVRTATNALSEQQTSVPPEHRERIAEYLKHGGEENLLGLAHYAAHHLGGREVAVPEVVPKPQFGFFHLGSEVFATQAEFEEYLAQSAPHAPQDQPKVVLFGSFMDPQDQLNRAPVDAIIRSLEAGGAKVYPIFGREEAFALIRQVQPDLLLTFPHGRLSYGDEGVKFLSELNCPIVSALPLLGSRETWLADERGMEGGFMGQSITAPELDGIIEPLVVSSMEANERGLTVRTPMEDQIAARVRLALNWMKLRKKSNAQKRVVIVYYKSPGNSALSAGGLEVVPALWNTLKQLEREGYDLGGALPETPDELFALIQTRGKTLGQWALGSFEKFLNEAEPELVPAQRYAEWFQKTLSPKRQQETIARWGKLPGDRMVTSVDGQPHLVISRIQLGNVVIMPQPTVGGGDANEDEISSIHGTDQAVPHFYLGAYLWARYGFQADAIMHFGTHGSLEFTYGKSNSLSRDCWPQILMGDIPHIYPYVINNVGEALVAKRRSNAVIVSHLTPPFMEAGLYGDLSLLHDKIHDWEQVEDPLLREETLRSVTQLVNELNLAEDLGLPSDALADRMLTEKELTAVHNYIHQLKDQSVTDGLHVIGRQLSATQIQQTTTAMLGEQGVDQLLAILGRAASADASEYRQEVAAQFVQDVLSGELHKEKLFTPEELAALQPPPEAARPKPQHSPDGKSGATQTKPAANKPPAEQLKAEPEATLPADATTNATGPAKWQTAAQFKSLVLRDAELQRQLLNLIQQVQENAENLKQSPEVELAAILHALDAQYIAPSSGGDPLGNPAAVPTGKNLYSINAEQTPTPEAWRVGMKLTDQLLETHRARHEGQFPRQVAISLWGSEFIRGKGTAIAQILYLMGMRPVWNSRGVVYDIEVIPDDELARPRVDVLVQTSGQFRDAAASRIALIDKAVQIVSKLEEGEFPNFVRRGTEETERTLKAQGASPKDAREFATARIFGSAANSSYGTQIMGLVERGDSWEDPQEVASQYIKNMSGVYRDGGRWGTVLPGLLEAQMQGVDAVVHPRSSNTWGPLSLDHVYEFMGGITLAVRETTGNDPDGYFSDLRQPGRAKVTTSVAAIREEARTSLWNPKFIQSMQREGPSAAASFTETVRNMYGWNVMQPSAISQDMWNETYQVYVEDKHDLNMRDYFEEKNPYALQDLTAVMLETARKGYWEADSQQLEQLAKLHTELVAEFGAACSYETCGNGKFHEFLQQQLPSPSDPNNVQALGDYQLALSAALQPSQTAPDVQGIEMNEVEQELAKVEENTESNPIEVVWLSLALVFACVAGGLWKKAS